MLVRILLAALLAGVLSGVFATAVQAYRVAPLIIEAESYENVSSDGHQHTHETTNETTPHSIDAWAPEDGWERTFYTMLANILTGVAFSMILVAGVLLTRYDLTLQSGLVWGVCGFAVFVFAPNIGLSPELPGMPAANLVERQIWWIATVAASAAALLIFAFRQNILWMLAGLALIVAPHIYGAPVPRDQQSNVPAHLAAEFVTATMMASLLFWLFLGGLLGWLVQRLSQNTSHGKAT